MDNITYDRYKVVLPMQSRMAMEGIGKLIGSLTGCSGNTLPTNAEESDVLIPKGTKVCYALNGSSYTATLLDDMRSDQRSTLAELSNGRRTMIENDWVSDMNPRCGQDQLPEYDVEED